MVAFLMIWTLLPLWWILVLMFTPIDPPPRIRKKKYLSI